MLKKYHLTSLGPNCSKKLAKKALALLLNPWSLKLGSALNELKDLTQRITGCQYIFCLDSGRSALYLGLRALGVQKDDEVILQAYTCVVVPNSIKALGATPIYVDLEANCINMDLEDLEAKITGRTKVIIVQHTFGEPAKITNIKDIAEKHNLKIIEDCAHSLGSKYQGKPLGSFGDLAIFSFGREKVVSSSRGGVLATNNASLSQTIGELYKDLSLMPLNKIVDHLLAIPLFAFGRWLYGTAQIGKIFLRAGADLRLIPPILEPCEKKGKVPSWTPRKFPNALAVIVNEQLKDLSNIQQRRFENAKYFQNKLHSYFEFPQTINEDYSLLRLLALHPMADDIIKEAKCWSILLGDWYRTPIAPSTVDPECVDYKQGSCPRAEELARNSFNLPTNPDLTKSDLDDICNKLINVHSECAGALEREMAGISI